MNATSLYLDYRAWLSAVERRAKYRELLSRRFSKYPLLARLWLASSYDAFAKISLRIELAFERLPRVFSEGGQHNPFHQMRKRKVLRQNRLEGFFKVHPDLSFVLQQRDDAESAEGASPPPMKRAGEP